MNWTDKLKEKAQERAIIGFFALITFLFLTAWAAVPSELWNKVSAAMPKRVLWALLGLALIAVFLEILYIYNLRKERNNLMGRFQSKPIFMFGAGWDKDFNPLCPSCEKPLTFSTRNMAVIGGIPLRPELQCPKCDKYFPLHDVNGKEISLSEAQKRVAGKATEQPTQPITAPPTKPGGSG